MPARVEQVGTYNTTVGVKISMDEAIHLITPSDVPLQSWLPSESVDSIKVEWMEEDLQPQTITLTGAVTGTSTAWTCPASDTSEVRVGDILQKVGAASNVQYQVDTVNANTSIVVSDFAGAAVAPANADVLQIVGQYLDEGSAAPAPRSLERVAKYNVTQWGTEKVQATRTQRKRAMYAQSDPYSHEMEKKFKELAIRFERSMVHGQRVVSGDSKRRFMGGLFYYISANSQSGTAANVKTLVNALLRKRWELFDGGLDGCVLMVSPAVKVAISAGYDPTLRRVDRTDRIGGFTVERVLTDFGEVPVVVNRHFPTTKALLLTPSELTRMVYDGYTHEPLAKTDDTDAGQIVGEFSMRVKNDKAHGILTITDAS